MPRIYAMLIFMQILIKLPYHMERVLKVYANYGGPYWPAYHHIIELHIRHFYQPESINFFFLHKNIFCGYPLEAPRQKIGFDSS